MRTFDVELEISILCLIQICSSQKSMPNKTHIFSFQFKYYEKD